mmetsp:Transcript_139200/g.253257  ORF Transcript_139200/g.253257 Transcript_139200/m.253257 type:complete len:85 (+) Transcript_139200:27-281(+)
MKLKVEWPRKTDLMAGDCDFKQSHSNHQAVHRVLGKLGRSPTPRKSSWQQKRTNVNHCPHGLPMASNASVEKQQQLWIPSGAVL